MNNKNRLFLIGVLFLFTCIVPGCGTGLGHHKPSHIPREQVRQTDPGIIIESLRDDMEYHVILLAGQSNMVGAGDIADLEQNQYQLPANIDYYNFGRGNRS